MGKLLRILSVVILVLGLAALTLAYLNYRKRELLIGRTHLLEETVIRVAGAVEAEAEESESQEAAAQFPERDVSPVTRRILENPDTSSFWKDYKMRLEKTDRPLLDFSTDEKRLQLRQYYRVNAAGERVKDPIQGGYSTRGEGTMRALLDTLVERARAQNLDLNQARAQMKKLREELVSTIEELNKEKSQRRENLAQIEEHKEKIAQLTREKGELQERIRQIEQENRELQINIAELNNELNKKEEELAGLKAENARLLKAREAMRDSLSPRQPTGGDGSGTSPEEMAERLSAGEKGTVVVADNRWSFVIVELSDETMTELLGEERDLPFAPVEMMVRRPGFEGPADEFITKIRLIRTVPEDNLFIADNLTSWQQAPVQPGDQVFF